MKQWKKSLVILLSLLLCLGFLPSYPSAEELQPDESEVNENEIVEEQDNGGTSFVIEDTDEPIEELFDEDGQTWEAEAVSELTWTDILKAGIFDEDKLMFVTENVTIPADAILVIQSGEVIISPEATLTIEGLLVIDGGTLTVSEGATLKNEMFIEVLGDGDLTVAGTYMQPDSAAIVWDASEGVSSVNGIDASLIDKTIYVESTSELNAVLNNDGFRILTILVPDAAFVKEVDQIPDGVNISVR